MDKDLQTAWVAESAAWIDFARSEAADPVFWRFNLPSFLELVPAPGKLTLDVGCGEGRLGRALTAMSHRVIGVDISPSLVAAASSHPSPLRAVVGNAATLPFRSAVADLVVLFMVVPDVDDLEATLEEASRVLVPGGRLCVAMGHPLQGVGDFSGENRDGPYMIQRPYFERRRLTYWAERAGRRVALNFVYRPLSTYTAAVSSAGFLVEALNEPCPGDELAEHLSDLRQRRIIPSLLHLERSKASATRRTQEARSRSVVRRRSLAPVIRCVCRADSRLTRWLPPA